MGTIKQDWNTLGDSFEGGLKDLLNGLIDGAITDLDGPVREIAKRLTIATKRGNFELVAESRDQLAMIVLEKELRLNVGGMDIFEFVLNLGMTALVNGAIGGLGALKISN